MEFLLSVESDAEGFEAKCQQLTPDGKGPVFQGRASTFNGAMIAAMSQLLLGHAETPSKARKVA